MSTVPKRCGKCDGDKVWSGTRWYCRPCQAQANRDRKAGLTKEALERERLRANELRNFRRSQWTEAQREAAKASVKSWRESNRERYLSHARDWYWDHVDHARSMKLNSYYANPEPFLARNFLRKARQIEAICAHGEDCVTPAFLASLYAQPCRYCGDPATEADHFYPLSRQGLHCRENLVPSCLPCNRSKHASDPHEWMASRA